MKRVVSVSLGSSSGDFEREIRLDTHTVRLSREGMDGSLDRARDRIRQLDSKVDAIGLGGIDLYLYVGGKQFVIGDALRLAEAARQTPVVDGSGLKNTLEREVVLSLAARGLVKSGDRVLLPSALDRWGMADSFVELGCSCVFGDLIFNIGFDFPLTSLAEVEELAEKYRSRMLTTPIHQLYPIGESQDRRDPNPLYAHYYEDADIIAGDRHLLLRHMPPRIPGKGIVTTTTRPETLRQLQEAGVRWVATTTPDLDGVSGGTNIMEAAVVAVMEKPPAAITPDDYRDWIYRLGWHGAVHEFS